MKLIDVYKALLKYAGLSNTPEGLISIGSGEDAIPFVIKGKRVVLPTTEQLRLPDFSERVVFHPLLENCLRDESLVVERYRTAINVRMNRAYATIMEKLLILVASTADQRQLGPDQVALFSAVQKFKIDEKTVQRFQDIMRGVPAKELSRLFVNVYVRRGAVINGVKYARAGIVSFPFYEELVAAEASGKIRNVSVPKKDINALKALMEYITPNLHKEHSYDVGTNSKFAPTMESLLQSSAQVASRLNDTLKLFEKTFSADMEEFYFSADWADAFDDIPALELAVKTLPMQAGNEGASGGVHPTLPASTGHAHSAPPPVAPASTVPVYPWNQSPAAPAPYYPPPAPAYPPVGYGMPGYPQPAQQPPSVISSSGRGTDFETLCRVNPNLAAAVNANQPQVPYTGFAQQRAGFNMGQVQQPFNNGWGVPGSSF